jgi:hypothetical protein
MQGGLSVEPSLRPIQELRFRSASPGIMHKPHYFSLTDRPGWGRPRLRVGAGYTAQRRLLQPRGSAGLRRITLHYARHSALPYLLGGVSL